jgi:hypothetical protein
MVFILIWYVIKGNTRDNLMLFLENLEQPIRPNAKTF